MRASSARVVLAPTQEYICLSCRLQGVGVAIGYSRRYKHTNKKSSSEDFKSLTEAQKYDTGNRLKSLSTISNFIKGFISNDAKAEGKSENGKETKADTPEVLSYQVCTLATHQSSQRLTMYTDL